MEDVSSTNDGASWRRLSWKTGLGQQKPGLMPVKRKLAIIKKYVHSAF